ncbi:MAG: Ig-like domain-containing protein [Bacteroidetes bacterium]|nr:Ig-like domain-containing protein [Bacteroidota bacterium]
MKKFTITKSLILTVFAVFFCSIVFGQTVVFSESMGTVGATTTIAVHEANNGFDNDDLTMTDGGAAGAADIRATSISAGYAGASGGANIWFAAAESPVRGFAIEGINASSFTNLKVQFGYRKESGTVLPTISLDYWNGSEYVNVPFTFNEAAGATAGWYLSPEISLPAAAQINGLKLRWVKSGTIACRIDDVKLSGIATTPVLVSTPSILTYFGYVEGEGPSTSKSIVLTGENLNGTNVFINANEYYEVSLDDNDFFESIQLSAYNGSATNIYARLKEGLSVGLYSENITISGGGASSINVGVSGKVISAFGLDYTNAFRSEDDIHTALLQGFIFNGVTFGGTAGGGYTLISNMGSIESPIIDFTLYDGVSVQMALQTFGGNTGQMLSVLVSNNGGATYSEVTAFAVPSAYEDFNVTIPLSGIYNVTSGKLKFEMTDGTNQIRFRDLLIEEYIEPEPETFTVYFSNPYNWNNVYVYSWEHVKGLNDWPGVIMNAPEPGSPWFSYDIPAENNYVIFNNGSGGTGNQTANQFRTETGYYNGMNWYNTEPELATLALSLNMMLYQQNNSFKPWDGDYVEVAGEFNVWGEFPLVMTHSHDFIYSINVNNVVVGDSYEFKFRINNNSWGGPWWENDPNRSVTINDSYVPYSAWFNNEEPIVSANVNPTFFQLFINWEYQNPAEATITWNSASEVMGIWGYDHYENDWYEMSEDAWEVVDIDGNTATLLIDLEQYGVPYKSRYTKDNAYNVDWTDIKIVFDVGEDTFGAIAEAYKSFTLSFEIEDELGNPIADASIGVAPVDSDGIVFDVDEYDVDVAARADYNYIVTASGYKASLGDVSFVEEDRSVVVVLEALTGDEISASIDTESLTYYYNWPTEDSEIIITYNDAVSVINFSFSEDGEVFNSLLSMYGPKDEGGLWEILNDDGETASLWIYWENAPNKNIANKEMDYILDQAFLRIDFLIGDPADIDFLFAAKTFEVAFDIKDELGDPIANAAVSFPGVPGFLIFNQDGFAFDLAAMFEFPYYVSAPGYLPVSGEIEELMEDKVINIVMTPFISATIDPTFLDIYDNWDNEQFQYFTITWNDAEEVIALQAYFEEMEEWFTLPSEMWEVVDIDGLTAQFIIDIAQSPGKSNFNKENDYVVESIDWRVVFNAGEAAYGVTNIIVKTFDLEFVVKNNNGDLIPGAVVDLMPWYGDDNGGDIWNYENDHVFEVTARRDYEYIITAPGYIAVQNTILNVEEDIVLEIFMDIQEYAIIGVGAGDPIIVDFGTALEDVNLPETVFVLLENSSWNYLEVTWDGGTPEYNALAAGSYDFEGTLTLIEGIINPYDAKAYITVVVNPEKEILAVASFDPIQVFIGTEIGNINFPTHVDVTLDDSSVIELEVIWDGGTPAYDGDVTDTYVFEGDIQLVTGIINTAGHTASINVIVFDTEKVIASVEEVDDITVFYGTDLVDIVLPTQLVATTEDDYSLLLGVVWDNGTPVFDSTTPDTYVFTGTLAMIPGFINTNNVEATVNVIVVLKEVVAVAELEDITVEFGTEFGDLDLPIAVEVTLDDDSVLELSVEWNPSVPAYDGNTAGSYPIIGTLMLIDGIGNTAGLTALINVTVEEEVVDLEVVSVASISDITVEFGTEYGDLNLPPSVEVTLDDSSVIDLAVEWNSGTPAYNGNVAGTYPIIGTLILIDGVANTAGLTALVNVIVQEEEEDVIISVFPYIQPFEDGEAPYGWRVQDNNAEGFVWEFNGNFAFADSDAAGNGAYVHTTLYTPIFDVSSLNNPRFSFDHYFRIYDGSIGKVKYTTDGETWNTIVEYEETTGSGTFNSPNYASAVIAIGDLIGNANQFQIAFEYDDLGNREWYWIVDNFVVEETPVANTFEVTFSVQGANGSIAATVDGNPIESGDEVEEGKNIVFTASPDTDYIVKAWYLNGSVVTGETGVTYTYNNITADIEVKVEFEYSNVINDIVTADVRVYPNPARTNALINSDSRIKEIVMVGMLGDVVFEQAVGDMSYNLNVTNCNPGIYFIRIVTENGIVTKRLIVN